jgi:methylase of polypeptide subunit release factors
MRAVAVNLHQDFSPVSPAHVSSTLSAAECALLALGEALRKAGYRFTTITPASHHRIVRRAPTGRPTLRDIFGWSRSFAVGDLAADMLGQLDAAGALMQSNDRLRSAVRFSTLGEQMFVHSAFPTEEADAVFFGPDTYRFARAIVRCIATFAPRRGLRILDVGAGSGAGGLHAAALLQSANPSVTLTDINAKALRYGRINAALNRAPRVEIVKSDLYADVDGAFDLIVSNPPYLIDPLARLYRHGGGELGSALSVRIAEQGIERLAPGGRLLLYTGTAIIDGIDLFERRLRGALSGRPVRVGYEEIDPDVFGEELDHAPYDRAERIAVVAVTIDAK